MRAPPLFGVADVAVDACRVPLGDDGRGVGVAGGGGQQFEIRRADRGDKRLEALRRDVHGVRVDAQLTGVGGLADRDPVRGGGEVGRTPDDRRGLAAELERDGHQVAGGVLQHRAARGLAAGEHDVVERQCRQGLRHVGTAGDDRDVGGVEELGGRLGQHLCGAGDEFGRLEHSPVPGGQHPGERAQEGEHRRVPGSDDRHRPLRLVLHRGGGAQLVVRGEDRPVLGPHPLLEVVTRVLQRGQRAEHVVDGGVPRVAATEVGVDRLDDPPAAGDEHVDHPLDPGAALRRGAGPSCAKLPLLVLEQRVHVGADGCGHGADAMGGAGRSPAQSR